MLEAVVSLLTVLVVGGLLFLVGSLLLGRGETQPPADPDRSPLELPEDRPVTADDVRGVRMSVTVRGYRMTEVDWLLEQLAQVLEQRDEQITALRARLDEAGRAADGVEDPPPTGAGGHGAPPPGAAGNGVHGDA